MRPDAEIAAARGRPVTHAGFGRDGRLRRDELQSDHDCLRALLEAFGSDGSAMRRRDLLRLAIDLFDTHTQIEDAVVRGAPKHARAELFDLIETIEMTDPGSKLYLARGLELRQRLEEHLDEEERGTTRHAPAADCDEELLHFRDVLRERAQHLLQPPAPASVSALAA